MAMPPSIVRSAAAPALVALLSILLTGLNVRADDVPPVPPPPSDVPSVPPPPPPAPPVPSAPVTPDIPPIPPVPPESMIPLLVPAPDVSTSPSSCVPPPRATGPGFASSPPPPARASAPVVETHLDELLAQVEGEYLTRRAIARQIGKRTSEEDEATYEKHVHAKLVQRVVTRILIKAAQRFGLDVRLDVIDKYYDEASRKEVKEAQERAERIKPGSGAGITFEKLLAERGQTKEEFKRELGNELLVQNYFHILIHGVPGKRAQFDPEPSPGDALRLYQRHPGAFDVKPGVRVGVFMLRPSVLYNDGAMDFDHAVAETKSRMNALLAKLVAGEATAAALARTYGVDPDEWAVDAPGVWRERVEKAARPFDAWAFDPARRLKETTLLDVPGGVVMGVAMLEQRAARARSFDDLSPDLLSLIRAVRTNRFQAQHTLDVLRTASVEPRSLLEEIEDNTRERLRRLDADPVTKDIRMR